MGLAVSTPAQYAVRALVYLARRNAAEAARVRDVAAAENIPYPFLAKLVGQLVQAGFLDSFKGPTGGIRLAKPPHRISVLDVITAIDGSDAFQGCFLGLRVCSEESPCPLHNDWKIVREKLVRRLESASIADLASNSQPQMS